MSCEAQPELMCLDPCTTVTVSALTMLMEFEFELDYKKKKDLTNSARLLVQLSCSQAFMLVIY